MYVTAIKTEKDKDNESIYWRFGESMERVPERKTENGWVKEREGVKQNNVISIKNTLKILNNI